MWRWRALGLGCLAVMVFVWILLLVVAQIRLRLWEWKEVEFPQSATVYLVLPPALFAKRGLNGYREIFSQIDRERDIRNPALRRDGSALAYWRMTDGAGAELVVREFHAKGALQSLGTARTLLSADRDGRLAWSRDGRYLAWYTYDTPPDLPETIRTATLSLLDLETSCLLGSLPLRLRTRFHVPPYWSDGNEIVLFEIGKTLTNISPSELSKGFCFDTPLVAPVGVVQDAVFYFDDPSGKCGLYRLSRDCERPRLQFLSKFATDVSICAQCDAVLWVKEETFRSKGKARLFTIHIGPRYSELLLVDVKSATYAVLPYTAHGSIAGILP